MAKICGCIGIEDDRKIVEEYLRSMIRVMKHNPEAQEEYVNFEQGGIALVRNSSSDEARSLWNEKHSSCLALCGHVVGFGRHKVHPYEVIPCEKRSISPENNAGFLLRAFEQGDEGILEQSNGVFSLAYYNSLIHSLTVANDRYSFMPLYYYHDKNLFLFASEVKAILQVVGQQEFDLESFADFFYVGNMLGQKTLFRNVYALGPGQILTYRNGDLRQSQYYDFTKTPVLDRREVSTERVASLFTEAVRRRIRTDKPNTVLLSGGLDSRLILFVLHSLGVTPKIVTLEHADEEGGADGRLASQVARHLGLEYELRRTRYDFYSSRDWLEVFYILDGMVPNWQLFISQVYPELESSLGTVWDGLAMGIALGGQHTARGTRKSFERFHRKLERVRSRKQSLLKEILTPEAFRALDGNFMRRVQDEIDQVPASENQFLNFLVKHRTRRRISVNPHQLYASRVEPMTPGTDIDFLDYVLGIPLDLKRNHRLYLDMVREHFPSLTAISIISEGKKLPLERQHRKSTSVERFARKYDKRSRKRLSRVFSRRKHLPGHEPTLSRLMVSILEAKHFDRPLYNKSELSQQLAAYRSGNSNNQSQQLLTIAFYIELWHLMFVDKDSSILFNP